MSLLKLYITGLSVATVVSVACVVRSDLSVKVRKNQVLCLRQNDYLLHVFLFIFLDKMIIFSMFSYSFFYW